MVVSPELLFCFLGFGSWSESGPGDSDFDFILDSGDDDVEGDFGFRDILVLVSVAEPLLGVVLP